MSDRVGYFVGNTNGRDHIMWPTITPAQLTSLGYTRAAGCGLATIMAMAWRVRSWEISGNAGIVLNAIVQLGGGATSNITVTSAFTLPTLQMPVHRDGGGNVATQERDLVSSFKISEGFGFRGLRNFGFAVATPGVFAIPPPPVVFVDETTTRTFFCTPPEVCEPPSGTETGTFSRRYQSNLRIFGNTDDAEYVSFDPATQLFYPYIICNGLLLPEFAAQIFFNVDPSGSNGTLTINTGVSPSFVVPLKIQGFIGSGPFITNTVISGAVTVTMNATSFWPYKNSQGDPVYDSASGAQINDPFS